MNKRFIIPIMTIATMIFIISIMGIARWSLKINYDSSIPTTSSKIELIGDKGLNETEKNVLIRISNFMKFPNTQDVKENDNHTIYYNYLREYLSSPGIDLSPNTDHEMEELIKDRNAIMYLEMENDVSKMSFDGREVAIYILKQIYELNGLKLIINMEGDIEQITEMSGNIIYLRENQMKQAGFQFNALAITLTTILTLFSICIIIAKKNQLFVKGGKYDGFDEKEFA